jgi:hypothetical protein
MCLNCLVAEPIAVQVHRAHRRRGAWPLAPFSAGFPNVRVWSAYPSHRADGQQVSTIPIGWSRRGRSFTVGMQVDMRSGFRLLNDKAK